MLRASYLRGRLILAGVDPDGLPLPDLVDVAYALLIDSLSGLQNVEELHGKVSQWLAATWVDRDTWGMGEAAQAPMREIPAALPSGG